FFQNGLLWRTQGHDKAHQSAAMFLVSLENSMNVQRLSRRHLLRGMASASAMGALPVFVSTHSSAADAVNLTLPWIPEGEVAFMYAARNQGFWAQRGLEVTITRGFGSGEAAKNVGLKRYEYGQADIGAMIKTSASGLPLVSI